MSKETCSSLQLDRVGHPKPLFRQIPTPRYLTVPPTCSRACMMPATQCLKLLINHLLTMWSFKSQKEQLLLSIHRYLICVQFGQPYDRNNLRESLEYQGSPSGVTCSTSRVYLKYTVHDYQSVQAQQKESRGISEMTWYSHLENCCNVYSHSCEGD